MADDGWSPPDGIAPQAPVDALIAGRLASLLKPVQSEPHEFDLFQLLRRIDALCVDHPRLGRSTHPAEDVLRIGQAPTMNFAPSTIASLTPATDTAPAQLDTYVFGLFGPNGALPLHLTDYARARLLNHGDPTFAKFADLFHHRLATLFFRAWAASEPTVSHDRPDEDRFARQLASLAGLGLDSLRDRDAMPDLAKLHFTGRLSSHARNPDGLQAILGSFFAVPVAVQEFIPGWVSLPASSLCRLGEDPATGTLGSTASAGSRVRLYHHRFRLRFGPLTLRDYERFLPGCPSLLRLVPVVRNYIGDELAWDLNLVLKFDEVPKIELGRSGRIGWTAWIGTRRDQRDADDLTLNPFLRVTTTAAPTARITQGLRP